MANSISNGSTLTIQDAIHSRPGMYLGDLGVLGACRIIETGVKVLATLSAHRANGQFIYKDHAFLRVKVINRHVQILINFSHIRLRRLFRAGSRLTKIQK